MAKQIIRPIDGILNHYSNAHPSGKSKRLQMLAVLLLSFGFLGFVWSIPFPHLDFLGRYNGFVNWASFLLAFVIYYYYRLSPVLSYGALLLVFAYSAGIVGLEKIQPYGVPGMGIICLVILLIGFFIQFLSYSKGGSKPSVAESFTRILVGPAWMLHFLFKKAGIKY